MPDQYTSRRHRHAIVRSGDFPYHSAMEVATKRSPGDYRPRRAFHPWPVLYHDGPRAVNSYFLRHQSLKNRRSRWPTLHHPTLPFHGLCHRHASRVLSEKAQRLPANAHAGEGRMDSRVPVVPVHAAGVDSDEFPRLQVQQIRSRAVCGLCTGKLVRLLSLDHLHLWERVQQ